MNVLKTFLKYSIIILLISILLTGIFSLFVKSGSNKKIPVISSYKLLNVLGGSMEPAIKLGSVIIINKVEAKNIKVGDIITFRPQANLANKQKTTFITHRAIKIFKSRGHLRFKTKGDANKTADVGSISEQQVVGRVVLVIPFMGKIGFYTKTPTGFLFLIIIPGLVVIILEIMNILKQVKSIKNKKET